MATAGETELMTFDDTLGPFLIGTLLTLFLQGATLYQGKSGSSSSGLLELRSAPPAEIVFFANCHKTREPWGYIVLVAGVAVCDVLHSAFAINTIWLWIVGNFGNPAILALSPWSFTAEPVMTGLMALVVHLFYAHRVWLVSEKSTAGTLVTGSIATLTVVQFAFSAAVTGKIVAYDRQFLRFVDWLWGACVWLGLAAAVDLIICFGYFHWLGVVSKQMAGPFERSTKSVVKVGIIILATNGLSAAAAVTATVLFGVLQKTNYHAIAQLCLSKLLALSLLVALNARNLLADLLGVEAGYFTSFGTRSVAVKAQQRHGAGAAGQVSSVPDGVYGRAAAQGGFDGGLGHSKSLRSPGGPGSRVDLSVEGVGGLVYPISMPGSGADSPSPSSLEKEAPFALEDALEHATVATQPFLRTSSDVVVEQVVTHPYNAHAA
ncbi:hypothetical protein DMC30DRAFT_446288 [Rhodotorula diobovata]|uniref:DUF6534 domain-containing protein n=1 Tax=Rhodotorula diobovata TaxID=5288 RepID=A0A5C5FX00_9BASI|nr:hypothetical protein DMC30DRAFT_446288 [Rhodotorula diobovata]